MNGRFVGTRMVKLPLRSKSVGTKVTEAEFAALEMQAQARQLTLSEWVRADLLEPRRMESGAAGEVLLREVLALRMILLNFLFSLTNGEAVTPEALQELIARADGGKSRRAMERLTAVAATVPELELFAAAEAAEGA